MTGQLPANISSPGVGVTRRPGGQVSGYPGVQVSRLPGIQASRCPGVPAARCPGATKGTLFGTLKKDKKYEKNLIIKLDIMKFK